jgi:hypothetical protein
MSNETQKSDQAARLNAAIRALHDELKSLVLTCAPEFPKEATGGLEFLADLADLQASVAAYDRELLVRLFRSASRSVGGASSILSNSVTFTNLWEQRGKLSKQEKRPENEIDAAIRKWVNSLLQEMRLLGEEELRALNINEDVPGMLYYLSTLEQALCWYSARYLARLTGELAKMESNQK